MTRRLDCMRDLGKTDMVESEQRDSQASINEGKGLGVPITRDAITNALRTPTQTGKTNGGTCRIRGDQINHGGSSLHLAVLADRWG